MTATARKVACVQQRSFIVGIADGDGVIARFGDVVMYASGADESIAQLLAGVDAAARTQYPGVGLPERLAPIAFGPTAFGPARAVQFGIVAPVADGFLVLLKGPVTADIRTPEGGRSVSGLDGPRFATEVVPEHALNVRIRDSNRPSSQPRLLTDLRAGIVPGGGFGMIRAGRSIEPPPRMESVATAPPPAEPPRLPMPVETAVATRPVGVLSTKDGAVYPLDRPYVIGRAPLSDDAVANASASPIVVEYDPHISRVHAYVTVDRNGVFVRDASTPAGTFIAPPGAETWTQIGSTPARLDPGWTLRIGDWIVTHLAGGVR